MADKFIEIDGKNYLLCPEDKVPKDNSEFPSYESKEYENVEEDLKLVSNIYQGGKNVECYLPQWTREPKTEYEKRVERTLFQNFFKTSVNGFPGFLSDIRGTENLYQGIQDCIKDIDLRGNGFESFFWQADLKVIRDGYCGILIEMPKIPRDENGQKTVKTLSDQKKVTLLRPYLVLLDRRNILSGYDSDERITIREFITQPVGKFGSQSVTRYRTFCNDGSYCVQVILIANDEPYVATIEEGIIDLKELPIVLYSATDINPTCAVPPLLNLAEKNKAHYELYSEYRELIHKINNPTAVRTGVVMAGQKDFSNLPPLILGANTAIDVPTGGDFKFVSPSPDAFNTDRNELDKLEVSMNLETLKFMSADGGNKTATEIMFDSAQTQATLSGLATLKESMLEEVADKWAGYYGAKGKGGTCKVNRDLLSMPLSSQDMATLSNLAQQNQLSVISLLEIMAEGKRLPKSVTPAQEIKRLNAAKIMQAKTEEKLKLNSNQVNKTNKSNGNQNN